MSSSSVIPSAAGREIVTALIEAIARERQHLSDIDGLIGDGDHGVNMHKGFQQCGQALGESAPDCAASLRCLADALLEIGGSMGPLYSAVFRAMSRESVGRVEIDASTFAAMLAAAAAQVRKVGSCELGDKTLLDVLAPAANAFRTGWEQSGEFGAALEAMKQAAQSGCAGTAELVARKGRASRLGERSRGVPDPGATSCAVLLTAMADAMLRQLAAKQPVERDPAGA